MKFKPTFVGAAIALLATMAHATEFKSADIHNSDDYPTVTAVRFMSDELKKTSGGKNSIKVFNKGALGTEKETIDQVKIGALDMVRVNISPMNSVCAKTNIPVLPFLFRSVDHLHKVLDGPIGDEIAKDCEAAGFVLLAYYDSGARSIYSKKPVKSVADTKGMKIRVQQSDLWVALTAAMGANPTPMPFGEVMTALKTGIIDAAENNYPSYETAKHYEAAPVYSETQHVMAPEVLVFSKKVWDTLSAEEHKIIRDAVKETIPYYIDLWSKKELASKDAAKKAGATFVEDVHKAEFVAVMKPVWDKFSPTPELKALVQKIVNTK